MKNAIVGLILVSLVFSTAYAQDETPAPEGNHPLYIGLGTGADLPGSQWDPNYLVGGGADFFGGYRFDAAWAAQLSLEEWFFTGSGSSLFNFRLLAEAKYTFPGPGLRPYILAGPGLVYQTLSPTGDNTANFDALVGAGIQFPLAPRTQGYVQAQYNLIASQSTAFSDFPLTLGVLVEL
jgi:opacity protein-like surface antigen